MNFENTLELERCHKHAASLGSWEEEGREGLIMVLKRLSVGCGEGGSPYLCLCYGSQTFCGPMVAGLTDDLEQSRISFKNSSLFTSF